MTANQIEVAPAYAPRRCLCGAAEGTTHSWDCPWPMDASTADQDDCRAWNKAMLAKRDEQYIDNADYEQARRDWAAENVEGGR